MIALSDIRKEEVSLTEVQLLQLLTLLTKGCRAKTKARLVSILTYSFSSLPNRWYWERFFICEHTNKVSYCAGQDYGYEIASIRTSILKDGGM